MCTLKFFGRQLFDVMLFSKTFSWCFDIFWVSKKFSKKKFFRKKGYTAEISGKKKTQKSDLGHKGVHLATVQSRINRGMSKHSVELNYCSNRKIFMQHIRLIHKLFPQKNIWPISADRPDFWIFRFFFLFFSRNFCGIAFFSEKSFFGEFFRYPKGVETSRKIFWETT